MKKTRLGKEEREDRKKIRSNKAATGRKKSSALALASPTSKWGQFLVLEDSEEALFCRRCLLIDDTHTLAVTGDIDWV